MESYLIGGGAILEAGARSTITRATLHAQLSGTPVPPGAVLIDFESGAPGDVRRLLALGAGHSAASFERVVTAELLRAGVCGIEEIALLLAARLQTAEVHVFARWQPPAGMSAQLAAGGVTLVAHPLEQIVRAALVTEQRFTAWNGPRAA